MKNQFMKNIFSARFAALLPFAFLTFSCDKGGGEIPPEIIPDDPVQVGFKLSSSVPAEGSGVGIYAFFASEDGSMANAKYENMQYSASSEGALAPAADTSVMLAPDESLVYAAYAPFKASSWDGSGDIDGYLYPVDLTDQNDSGALALMWGKTGALSSSDVTIDMAYMLSKVEIAISQTAGVRQADTVGMSLRFEGLYNEGLLSLTDGALYNTGMPSVIVPVRTGAGYEATVLPSSEDGYAGRKVVVTLPAVGKEFSYDFPADYAFEKGKVHEIEILLDVDGIAVTTGDISGWGGTDSNPDVITDDKEYMSLPNSYIVKPGSTFRFPVAKAYAMWHNDPLLQGAGENIPNELKAEIIWQERFDSDETLLIATNDNVSIEGTGIDAVIVVKLNEGVEGNLCIGVKDEYDCWWSWHLWVTDYDPEASSSQYELNGQVFMTRNLGAVSEVAGPQSQGMYYQWGRKDAFPGSYTWERFLNGNVGWCNTGIGQITMLKSMSGSSVPEENMAASVKNPFKTINYVSFEIKDWLSPDTDGIPYRWSDENGNKTSYDPCPEGWRVPVTGSGSSSAWYGLGDVWAWSGDAQGLTSASGGYWPAGGYIDPGRPSGNEVATSGYLWGATSAGAKAYMLQYSASGINVSAQTAKYNALPVRCVKDNN